MCLIFKMLTKCYHYCPFACVQNVADPIQSMIISRNEVQYQYVIQVQINYPLTFYFYDIITFIYTRSLLLYLLNNFFFLNKDYIYIYRIMFQVSLLYFTHWVPYSHSIMGYILCMSVFLLVCMSVLRDLRGFNVYSTIMTFIMWNLELIESNLLD